MSLKPALSHPLASGARIRIMVAVIAPARPARRTTTTVTPTIGTQGSQAKRTAETRTEKRMRATLPRTFKT